MRNIHKFIISILTIILFFNSILLAEELTSSELKKLAPMVRFFLTKTEPEVQQYERSFDIQTISGEMNFNILIKFTGDKTVLEVSGVNVYTTIGQIATARASKTGIIKLAGLPEVEWVEISKFMDSCLDISRISTGADKVYNGNPSYRGSGIIVAVFDSGIDWRHEDFIDNQGCSRILYLWDMTDDAGPHPAGFDYGTEYTRDQISDEIDGSPTGLVREKDTNGHGTHVAGIAGGDGTATGNGQPAKKYIGIAPQADLIIVKGGDGSYSTTNQVNGMAYILRKVKELGRPVVNNFSIAGHWGAHDGTDLHEQAIDASVGPGKAVVIAAANDREEPLHASANVPQGSSVTTYFTVKDETDEFWITIWHEGTDLMKITITTPNGYTTPVQSSGSQENWTYWNTNSGRIGLIAPSKNPNNGDYEITIYVDKEGGTDVKSGAGWSFELSGSQITNGRFDAWTKGSRVEFTSNIDYTMLVGIPGTARRAVTVASYCTKNKWTALDGGTYFYPSNPTLWDISPFSSPGPSRDGRDKPEITAPGQGIVAALSRDSEPQSSKIVEDGVHFLTQGTSMAAPHVTGAVALLFEKNPRLTPEQIKEILKNSAWVGQYTGSVWNNSWGYGKLDIEPALNMIEGGITGTSEQHDIGAVNCGLTDWGLIGEESDKGPGFLFPINSEYDHGCSGSLVAGVWGEDVADSYGDIEHIEDDTWRTTATGRFRKTTPGYISDQDGSAQFEKMLLTPIGLTQLRVTQYSYAWSRPPYDRFVLIDYEITNIGPYKLTNFVPGFYMDWDCQPNYETNEAGYDAGLNLAYMWDSETAGTPYLATMILGQKTASFDIIDNEASVYSTNDLLDQTMYDLMSTHGIMGGIDRGDLSTLIAAAKFTLHPGKTTRFSIALLAGDNLADIQQSATRAREKYNLLNSGVSGLFYDDGTAEGGVYCTEPGEQIAVRFTALSYPASLIFANFYIREAEAAIKLNIYDDNGTGGRPGSTLLPSPIIVTPQTNSWNSVDLSDKNIHVASGDFYISLEWMVGDQPILGYDEEFPYAQRSWYFDGSQWSNFIDDGDPWDKRDVMIGAGAVCFMPVNDSENQAIPHDFSLSQNYPNPFNTATSFFYGVPKAAVVEISIYNILGQKIRTLLYQSVPPGIYKINWSGEDDHGNSVSSGIYFCLFKANKKIQKRKLILLR